MMKRESDENFEESEYYQDDSNTIQSEGNNAPNSDGPNNPPKRLRRTDDEEIRLLIPSKVKVVSRILISTNLNKLENRLLEQLLERVATTSKSCELRCVSYKINSLVLSYENKSS